MAGFIIGLALDAMSLAPLGFHTAIFSLIGYIFGKFQDNVGPGKFFLPAISLLGATALKYGVAFLLTAVFGFHSLTARFFSLNTLWEVAINLLLAPFVFPLVNKVAGLLEGNRGGFH